MMLPEVSNSGEAAAEAQPHAAPSAAAPAAAAPGAAADLGSSSGFSEDEKGRTDDGRTSGGNRWPRQETLYLLKIRQDMDAAFRDSTLKGPLWEEVSRKLASLGFHRSAKKCKEKFENVYKYHKRIKEGRSSKSDGKAYKFFDQLEALEAATVAAAGHHHHHSPPPPVQSVSTVVTPVDPISVAAPAVAMPAMNVNPVGRFALSQLNSSDSGSSTSSDDELPPLERRQSRKRKWEEFFGRLMKQVVEKQEELQVKFIETLERRERDRTAREEAWRIQEMAKMKREHDLLVQERSIVAAKDAAVIAFLQKIADQNPAAVIPQIPAMQLLQQQQQNHQSVAVAVAAPPQPPPQPTPPMQQQPQPQPQSQPTLPPQPQQAPPALAVAPVVPAPVPAPAPTPLAVKSHDNGGGGDTVLQPSPSRWPKAEINALIQIRTSLDTKYQEGGPKGPLWEEVSAAMRKLGYNRNAKRCKEKWENINKYYKKVKESSKKRPEDSKTCPYFHQLDAIYREKANANSNSNNNNNNLGLSIKPESQMAPIMARPEQQWPLPSMIQEQHHQYQHQQQQHQQQLQHQQQQQQQQQSKVNEPKGIEDHQNADLNDDDYEDDEDDDDEEGGDYEIVQNKTSSMAAV